MTKYASKETKQPNIEINKMMIIKIITIKGYQGTYYLVDFLVYGKGDKVLRANRLALRS